MGFEVCRFIGEPDDEFHCSICSWIFENPVLSPCDHIFCHDCIQGWLAKNESCPICRDVLRSDDLKVTPRCFRNMLAKLVIKCDFEAEGCQQIVKLEQLKNHVQQCDYNPNVDITCDKGCNMKIRRSEHETHNCLSYLINQNEAISLQLQLQHEEVANLRRQLEHFNSGDGSSFWQMRQNMKTSMNQLITLNCGDELVQAFVQSRHPLEPQKSSFKLEILTFSLQSWISIGLTRKGHPIARLPGYIVGSIGCSSFPDSFSTFHVDTFQQDIESIRRWKVSDIIECGIRFPCNFVNDGTQRVEIYFKMNEQLIGSTPFLMPMEGLFPTIAMYGLYCKCRYLTD